jgi:hypothetical protein
MCLCSVRKTLPLTLALGVVFVLAAQNKPVEAWWLRMAFVPDKTSYESLQGSSINPNWVRFSILDYSALPPEAGPDLPWMRRGGFQFRVDNYFRWKGRIDRELCGVFQDRAGKRGRFLVVLQRTGEGPWSVAFLHQEFGGAGFSILRRNPRGLFWGTCMQCEEFSQLRMTRTGGFSLEPAL